MHIFANRGRTACDRAAAIRAANGHSDADSFVELRLHPRQKRPGLQDRGDGRQPAGFLQSRRRGARDGGRARRAGGGKAAAAQLLGGRLRRRLPATGHAFRGRGVRPVRGGAGGEDGEPDLPASGALLLHALQVRARRGGEAVHSAGRRLRRAKRQRAQFCSALFSARPRGGGKVLIGLQQSGVDDENTGVAEALRRGAALLAARGFAAELPGWLFEPRFEDAVAACGDAAAAVASLRRAERALGRRAPDLANEFDARFAESSPRQRCALARLQLAATLERVFANEAATAAPLGDRRAGREEAARLFADSALVAAFASAHAWFLAEAQSRPESAGPSLLAFPCHCAELEFSALLQRRVAFRAGSGKLPMHTLLQMLTRSTSPGLRGWETLVRSAFDSSLGLRAVLTNALTVSLLGLHPAAHPAERPHWTARLQAQRLAGSLLSTPEERAALARLEVPMRELLRRLLAVSLAAAPAAAAAAAAMRQPAGGVVLPPAAGAPAGFEAASAAFMRAGAALPGGGGIAAALEKAFAADEQLQTNWVAKGSSSARQRATALSVGAELAARAQRGVFLPFWVHSQAHGARAVRVDAAQHDALRAENSARALAAAAAEPLQLAAQRLAVRDVRAGVMLADELFAKLDLAPARAADADAAARLPAEHAAALLVFARAAHAAESMLQARLGDDVAALQARALLRRYAHPRLEELLAGPGAAAVAAVEAELPPHASRLFFCVDCKRVASAHATEAFRASTCNEIGIAIAMRQVGALDGELRCAKRSSAALRVAQIHHADEQKTLADLLPVDHALSRRVFDSAGSTSASARARRDARNVEVQARAPMGCGDAPLADVPLLGRAVRLFGHFYTNCTLCGTVFKVGHNTRFGGLPVCLRCDAKSVGVEVAAEGGKEVVCRFCGAVDPMRGGVQKFKTCKSPLDESAGNATLPPNLRSVAYCPTHFKQWLPAAHRVLSSRVVLSHISLGARPVFCANGAKDDSEELGLAERAQRQREAKHKKKRKR